MTPSNRFLLVIPAVILVLVIGAVVVLFAQQDAAPACGAHQVNADSPVTLDNGVTVAQRDSGLPLRFDTFVLAESDLADAANAQVLAAVNAMPVNLVTRGSVLVFNRCGRTATPITLAGPAPDSRLDAYAWNGDTWSWLGSGERFEVDLPDLPIVVAWVEALPTAPAIGSEPDPQTDGLEPEYHSIVTEIYAPGLMVATNGSVIGQVPAAPPEGSAYAVYPVIHNTTPDGQTDAGAVTAMLSDAAARQRHVETLVSVATGSNFVGVAIDFRGLTAVSRDAYSALVETLADALHANGRQLVVVLPMPPGARAGLFDDTAGYDWRRIGRAADVVQIELPLAAARYQAGDAIESLLTWARTQVSRNKIQPIVSAASSEGDAEMSEPISFAEAVSGLLPLSETPQVATTAGAPLTLSPNPSMTLALDATVGVYEYYPAGETQPSDARRIHSAATLAYKLQALAGLRLRGVVVRDAQGPDVAPELLEPIKAYRQQRAITGSSAVTVNWTIIASDGRIVWAESRSLMDSDPIWTPDSDGVFRVKAVIASVEREVAQVTVGKGDAGGIGTQGPGAGGTNGICYNAAYVADVSVPDNTRFDKNKDFIKTWRVRNSGTCAWADDTQLVFVSGAQLGGESPVKVGALDVGKTLDVSVPMKSGDKDGAFTGAWQLRNRQTAFGDQLTVVIKVGAEAAAPPPPAAPPAAGGKIEYGIHAHFYGYIDTAAGAQKIASYTNELGLGWVKIQFRWGDYDYYCGGPDLNVLNTMIGTANAAGLKVMLSVVTAPPCTHPWTSDVHAPPDDPAAYAELVGGLADLFKGRVHAIEVWNEQNISREWKTSPQQLDANRYTQLLAAAYNAIKSKDPNILVISGALAPTGWNDGVNATDDFAYLQQMVTAGAAKYMDCVGTHVNALRVPPSAGLGGEYDSLFSPPHHSWYFKDTVQGYQRITGKPACVTEFGVASTETIGSVAGFEWAAENTQQEQADWVTEGMSLCRQYGCRLMILWNLDYGPATGLVNDNALYSFIDMGLGRRPVFHAVKNWCAANGCR